VPNFAQQKDAVDPKIEQQIRLLAMKYDFAINSHDGVAISALYSQDAVFLTHHDGSYHGRQAIEKEYERWYFKRWNKHNYATAVARVTHRALAIPTPTMGTIGGF
jgi:ketosteroid isomerase-like protein